jgi:ABC-type Zn uptake system ZnuABC Zn-binding protein ZnuA
MLRGRIGLPAAGAAVLAALLPLVILGCGGSTRHPQQSDWPEGKPKVVVSFAPLYCFAVNVAGDDATVKNVMTTTGPHDFSPTESDARLVSKADLFFVVGLGLDESKAELMKKGSGNEKLKIVELGEKIPEKQLCEGFCEHEGHKDDPNHHHDKDPHVWLSPDLAEVMVNAIRDELKAADPAHAAGYDQRAAVYAAKLRQLKQFGQAALKGKKDNRLVSFHDSLAYFAECYGLEIRGVLTQKPGQEPDARQMQKLIRICTDANKPTRVIAVEPQFSTSTSGEALRKELAAKGVKDPVLVEIDTLETVKPDELEPDWYEKRMRANLGALVGSLK